MGSPQVETESSMNVKDEITLNNDDANGIPSYMSPSENEVIIESPSDDVLIEQNSLNVDETDKNVDETDKNVLETDNNVDETDKNIDDNPKETSENGEYQQSGVILTENLSGSENEEIEINEDSNKEDGNANELRPENLSRNKSASSERSSSKVKNKKESLISSNVEEEEEEEENVAVDESKENADITLASSSKQNSIHLTDEITKGAYNDKDIVDDIENMEADDDVEIIELRDIQCDDEINEDLFKKEIGFLEKENSDIEESDALKTDDDGVDIFREDEILKSIEIELPKLSREEMIEQYQQCQADMQSFMQRSNVVQHNLCEYYRKKKGDVTNRDASEVRNTPENDQKYGSSLKKMQELTKREATIREDCNIQIFDLREKCTEKKALIIAEDKLFDDNKKEVFVNAVSARTGKTLPVKEVDRILNLDKKKDQEVADVRLENIKLKNKLKKKESQLKSREELAEGLHMIDFEQLKIENQTYNEKIEERNEELLKLRKKNAGSVQILAHMQEKSEFVEDEVQHLRQELVEYDEEVKKCRDNLTKLKRVRDRLRHDNNKLKQNSGLQGNKSLLRNYEDVHDETLKLTQRVENLMQLHAEHSISTSRFREKINSTKKALTA